jgi:hypothetical protein
MGGKEDANHKTKKPVPPHHLLTLTAVSTVHISKEYRVNFNNKYVWLFSTIRVLCRKQETENLHFYISEAVAVTLFICYKCIGYMMLAESPPRLPMGKMTIITANETNSTDQRSSDINC